jgi:hypothetical protein
MPSEHSEVAVAEVGGKIYVVGGFSGQRELEIYDPAARPSGGCSRKRAPLCHRRSPRWQLCRESGGERGV